MVTHEEWEVKYEIDINNPLKSIKKIYNSIKLRLAIKLIKELNIKKLIKLIRRKDYPKRVCLESSNGEIRAVFSKEPESLDKLLKYFKVEYIVSKDNIKESEIYEIVKKYGMNPKATYTSTYFYIEQTEQIDEDIYACWYNIMKFKDRLIVRALPCIDKGELYNSLRDVLKRFKINEMKIREIITNVKDKGRIEINFPENISAKEYINIYLENVKRGFFVKSSSEWKISEDHGGRIELYYNPKGYHIVEIGIYPPTEEKIKQLLTDMKNIGMDTKIKKITIFYI